MNAPCEPVSEAPVIHAILDLLPQSGDISCVPAGHIRVPRKNASDSLSSGSRLFDVHVEF